MTLTVLLRYSVGRNECLRLVLLSIEEISGGLLLAGCLQITVRARSGVKLEEEVLVVGSALNFLEYDFFLLGTLSRLFLSQGRCFKSDFAKVFEKPIRFVGPLGQEVRARVFIVGE